MERASLACVGELEAGRLLVVVVLPRTRTDIVAVTVVLTVFGSGSDLVSPSSPVQALSATLSRMPAVKPSTMELEMVLMNFIMLNAPIRWMV